MFKKMRRNDKQLSNEDTINLLINGQEGILGTLSENGYPYTIVLNYIYYNDKVYFHCAKEGLKIDNIRYHDKVSFTVYDDVEVIGEALNTKYKSLTLFGKARVMDATQDVLMALINKYANINVDKAKQMIQKEMNDTSIIEIKIDHITGKIGK
ncbi:MAG: pyridoxamine 5'-phosphate oxidase family protein [Tenericutes bacterium]|jgi:nitroimidazol reductase NimA-like FMN-containing flavoprotein (pyridoxamine 5'-phosphate oxidase superfamily)|nr:pyridoxamine 5'-phosphate oxidase family protein [Mycoplasmatota bacterium]